jgi:murein DD-endopeptidase MepM/ murein hydrolase activator NlpD
MAAVAGGALASLASPAAGQSSAALDMTGGAPASAPPRVTSVACLTRCAGVRAVRRGSVVELRGAGLSAASTVTFLGGPGRSDDKPVDARQARASAVRARVPRGFSPGPVVVTNADGARSGIAHRVAVVAATAAPLAGAELRSAGAEIDVELSGQKVYFAAERRATLDYMVRTSEPATVTVELVRLDDGASIRRWDAGLVEPNTPQSVTWNGVAGGKVQPEGRYEFRVQAQTASGVQASSAQAGADAAPGRFTFLGHKFPVRGKHGYGEFAAQFGGGRGHQGQDVFATCGTPLVAARGGVVKIKQYHSRAGHYIVIDGEQTGVDYAYMHLRDASLVNKGDRVYTGQLIGYVGDTGRAFGCHLHFEMWSAPGWYTGGAPFDPKPDLLAWDQYS